jgi:hypothetical protein
MIYTDMFNNKHYFCNGKLHREDGPALENTNGDKYWYLHGQLHREDGAAIENNDGTKYWYLQGKRYSEEEYWRALKLKSLW